MTQSCCELFKALADETRLLIVRELLSKPLIVGELAERLSISHYNVSKHLKVLRECGVIVITKEGRQVCSRLNLARKQSASARGHDGWVLELGYCVIRFGEA